MSIASSEAKYPAICRFSKPTKFECVINVTTAKARGLTVSDRLVAAADQMIE
jgi:hypothetical protein